MDFTFLRIGEIVYRKDHDDNRQFVCECRNGYYAELIPAMLNLSQEQLAQAIVACNANEYHEAKNALQSVYAIQAQKQFEVAGDHKNDVVCKHQ